MRNLYDLQLDFWNTRIDRYIFESNESGISSLKELKSFLDTSSVKLKLSYCRLNECKEMEIGISSNCILVVQPCILTKGFEIDFIILYGIEKKERFFFSFRTRDIYLSIESIVEDANDSWEEFLNCSIEIQKELQIKKITEKSIKALLESELLNFNHNWNIINDRDDSSLLEIKFSYKRVLKIRINHKSFLKEIYNIKKIVNEFEKVEKNNGVCMIIEHYGNNKKWKDPILR